MASVRISCLRREELVMRAVKSAAKTLGECFHAEDKALVYFQGSKIRIAARFASRGAKGIHWFGISARDLEIINDSGYLLFVCGENAYLLEALKAVAASAACPPSKNHFNLKLHVADNIAYIRLKDRTAIMPLRV